MHDFIKCLTAGVIAFIMQIKLRQKAAGLSDEQRRAAFPQSRQEAASTHTQVALKVIKWQKSGIMLLFH